LIAGLVYGALGIYCFFRYRLFSKAWRYVFSKTQAKPIAVNLNDSPQRGWIPLIYLQAKDFVNLLF
jgi:hypothetical protein